MPEQQIDSPDTEEFRPFPAIRADILSYYCSVSS